MTIQEVNALHAQHYGEGMNRKFPKRGIVSLRDVKISC